ncbi:ATP-binding cassette domain-containing protein, partial [Candidatus Fermentibacterales bacterium]|nr:ATP-binding cassette domain-containing protein [Candidatus Fermentibacterales bacterium]
PPVLRGMSLGIEKGEILALVGPSGAGKTTIAGLLARFYDPDGGRITMDGHDLRDVSVRSLRALLGVVTQDTVLFNASVASNIGYGLEPDPRDPAIARDLARVAREANALEFIESLPDGFETVIGEGGHSLSGGQRQRLAIARAMYKDPSILLLDEATSSLDSDSERLVQEAIERLMRGRTTLLIAHRFSSIAMANRIAVVDEGRILDHGSHAELMERCPRYEQLYRMQIHPEGAGKPDGASPDP